LLLFQEQNILLFVDRNKTTEPYILFVDGKYPDHDELETGDRSRMKISRINTNKDLLLKKIEFLLNKALNLCRNGTIKINEVLSTNKEG